MGFTFTLVIIIFHILKFFFEWNYESQFFSWLEHFTQRAKEEWKAGQCYVDLWRNAFHHSAQWSSWHLVTHNLSHVPQIMVSRPKFTFKMVNWRCQSKYRWCGCCCGLWRECHVDGCCCLGTDLFEILKKCTFGPCGFKANISSFSLTSLMIFQAHYTNNFSFFRTLWCCSKSRVQIEFIKEFQKSSC